APGVGGESHRDHAHSRRDCAARGAVPATWRSRLARFAGARLQEVAYRSSEGAVAGAQRSRASRRRHREQRGAATSPAPRATNPDEPTLTIMIRFRPSRLPILLSLLVAPSAMTAQETGSASRPFGTLREQAKVQQQWLDQRMHTVLPALMRKHGIDMWVV